MVLLTSPLLLKPRISKLMLDVRPDWISWRCLKRFSLALPRPLSSSPCVKTPNRVDFPESTLPSTATRKSRNCGKKTKNNTNEKRTTQGQHMETSTFTAFLLTCWSSGTLRMRTSAILRGTSKSKSSSLSLRIVMSAPTLSEKQTTKQLWPSKHCNNRKHE